MKESTRKWIEAGKLLAADAHGSVACPECGTGFLVVRDIVLEGMPERTERHMICRACNANNSLLLPVKYPHSALIWAALDSISELGSPKIPLYDMEDKYHHPPSFLFKFKDKKKDDALYQRVKNVIERYPGNIQWSIMTRDDMSNYLIYPEPFEPYIGSFLTYCEEHIVPVLGKEYYSIVDKAVDDIEGLARELNTLATHPH